jgi:hypothetical protein
MSGNAQQGDTLLFDMSQSTEGTPQIFVRRDWLSILDNMNQSYIGNQSIIDTSQLANSNKYMSYYEATLIVPLLLTMTSVTNGATGFTTGNYDYVMGLKNWLGTIVHSFTLDYNGTTIIQQTPFVGLWNTFCLMTSFNYNDFTEWASIGFYPDTSTSWSYSSLLTGGATFTEQGVGITNNQNQLELVSPVGILGQTSTGNIGFYKRQQYFAFDGVQANTPNGGNVPIIGTSGTTGGLVPVSLLNNSYKSYIFNKQNGGAGSTGCLQQAIIGQIKLRHLHNFFQEVPLLKGVFMKMTMNLNNTSFTLGITNGTGWVGIGNVVCPLGGVNPLMIASASSTNGSSTLATNTYNFSVAVGAKVLSSSQTTATGIAQSPMLASVMLNIPSYVYNPIYEQAYLSSSVKTIVYNDLYQYQVLNVQPNQTFNNLITNGISGIQTVLVLPFYSVGSASITSTGGSTSTTGNQGISPIQSPFTTEGGGTTSPLCLLGNFNVVISGQNAIYNTERFTYEQFTQQLYGLNATNGGLTDGVNSGLVNQMDFENMYNYYAVNVSRMLPIEEAVPKSVNIIGTNLTNVALDLYVFVNYKTSVSIDILTGSRV